ncbi:MAG TPA: hypothetical protein VHS97_19225 [Isosphaeraceae bacterium]|nr:hypothetical protein [Isosphaeraceae bacterium]
MKRYGLVTVALGWLCLSASGCATPMVARYIYQDADFGVVGIPVNNYQKKTDFRGQAEGLMSRHFPEGYEIVRAEEVNEGERILDLGKKTQIETDPKVAALNQMISLGSLNRTTSYEQKDKLQLRECRIIYRKKPLHTPGRSGQFASTNSAAPPLYIDPNEILRHQIKTTGDMLGKANTPSKKPHDGPTPGDAEVKKATVEPTSLNSNLSIPDQLDSIFDQMIKCP